MSLSPWDLSGRMGFSFDLYRPRRASYVYATRTNRQRNSSYRHATKSSLRHAGEHKADFIEGLVGRKRQDSYKKATQRDVIREQHQQQCLQNTNGRHSGFSEPDYPSTRLGANRSLCAIAEVPTNVRYQRGMSYQYETPRPALRAAQSCDQLSSMAVTGRSQSFDAVLDKKSTSLSSLKASSLDRKTIFNTLKEDEAFVFESIRRYRCNLVVLSIGFLLVFTAFRAIQNIQSSLNGEQKLGVTAMGCVHATMFLTCLFTPALINKFTSKWTMILGLLFYLFWIAANFYPQFYTLIPTSIGVGFGQSLAWGAQVTYIQKLADDYSQFSQEITQQELFKFNGIFLALFQTSHVWGNLLSSLLLRNSVFEGLVNGTNEDAGGHYCGVYETCEPELPYLWHADDPSVPQILQASCELMRNTVFEEQLVTCTSVNWNVGDAALITRQASHVVLQLMGGLLVFAFAGFLVLLFALEKIGAKGDSEKPCMQFVWTNVRMLHQHKKFRLLVPLLIFNGFEQGFIYADYTKSYITCTVGIEYVGYNMITLGVVNSVFSIIIGFVSRYMPREAIIGMGAILQVGLLIFLLVWMPDAQLLPVFFAVSSLWGICDSVWQTQCNYLVSVCCPDEHEVAFQNLRMLQGLGAATAFLLSVFVCANLKLIILIALLVIAVLCYVVVEIQLKNAELRNARNDTGTTVEARQKLHQNNVTSQAVTSQARYNGGMSRDSTHEKLNAVAF